MISIRMRHVRHDLVVDRFERGARESATEGGEPIFGAAPSGAALSRFSGIESCGAYSLAVDVPLPRPWKPSIMATFAEGTERR